MYGLFYPCGQGEMLETSLARPWEHRLIYYVTGIENVIT